MIIFRKIVICQSVSSHESYHPPLCGPRLYHIDAGSYLPIALLLID